MSWAWRSLLARFLPIRRHGSQLATVISRSNLIGSRGYASYSGGDATTKRHLYVVLDDQKDGFSIHKLDLSDKMSHQKNDGTRRLPDAPVLRVELTTLGERVQFAAVGSSIVAIGNTIISPQLKDRWIPDIGGVLIYDTKTAKLTVAAHLPSGLRSGYKAAMAVGNSLYMLGSKPPQPPSDWDNDREYGGGGSLHCLTSDLLELVDSKGDKFWGWELISRSLPWLWSHFECPPTLPFLADDIMAYEAHASPPGAVVQHELYVSLRPKETNVQGATFSFNTKRRKWRQCCKWHLPVVGRAHYDGHLDACVGLYAVSNRSMYGPPVTDGHLCIGNVMSAPTKWKVCKEKLFRLDEDDVAGWGHVDAKLVQIALDEGGSDYCLMERLRPKEEVQKEDENKGKREEYRFWGDGRKCLLRLTSFCIEHGQDGEPLVTARRLTRSYEVSSHSRYFDAQVFLI